MFSEPYFLTTETLLLMFSQLPSEFHTVIPALDTVVDSLCQMFQYCLIIAIDYSGEFPVAIVE